MQGLRGLACVLVMQSLGELLARALHLPFPGPVVGMVLLVLALRWPVVREPVAACADFLLGHLSLLFVPVGVGVMTHLALVTQYGGRMLVVIVLSTWLGLAVVALGAIDAGHSGRGAPPPASLLGTDFYRSSLAPHPTGFNKDFDA